MEIVKQIAQHLYQVHFGGNWTVSNLQEQLEDVNWAEASKEISGFNSIAVLTYHINYFVRAILPVFEGGELTANDKYSFDLPPIANDKEWRAFVDDCLNQAKVLSERIEQVPEEKLLENFVDPKYGSYYRNFHGLVEHTHYHLGQIAILKKLVRSEVAKGDH